MDSGAKLPEAFATGRVPGISSLPGILGKLVAPVPLFLLQPLLMNIVREIASNRPDLFDRLGRHVHSTYIVDVAELPFVLSLQPDPHQPALRAHRRHELLAGTATIAGPFMKLLKIVDGRGDSDALFFSRDIRIAGDTEAAVCLRHALDDMEGSIVEVLLQTRGLPLAPLRILLARLRNMEDSR
jgi:predicted lipid carrier protein YhbT